jgi:16S rRNA pseudouridine516 synthase
MHQMSMDKRPIQKKLRADKLLAGLGYGSRRETGAAIRRGAFRIGGAPILNAAQKLDPADIKAGGATFEGAPLDPLLPLTVLLHKPAGYICSHSDAGMLVFDLLPMRWRQRNPPLSFAGRLDKDSTGLVILSDDGDTVHRLISPRSDTPKTYLVRTAKPLSGNEAEIFASGTFILRSEKKPLKPVEAEILGERELRLVLREGRYHQVRRMLAATGNRVTALHREGIGEYTLDGLEEGAYKIYGA